MNLSVNHNIALLIAEKTSSPVILTDANQCIEWVNTAFTMASGYTLEEIRGKRPEFLHGSKTNKEVIDRIQTNLANGEICKEEMMNYAKDGSTYWVSLDILPITDEDKKITHFLAIEQDITELKRKEEAIKLSEQKLRAIYNSTNERNVLLNRDLDIVAFNKSVADNALTYFNRVIKEGDNIGDYLFSEEMVEQLRMNVEKVIENNQLIEVEREIYYPDGDHKWFIITYSPAFDDAGDILGVSVNLMDVTEHKKADNKILEQNFQLREIARMQSHEVRRPLSNILGLSNIIENHVISSERHKYILEKLKESAAELDEVVKKVVNTSVGDI